MSMSKSTPTFAISFPISSSPPLPPVPRGLYGRQNQDKLATQRPEKIDGTIGLPAVQCSIDVSFVLLGCDKGLETAS